MRAATAALLMAGCSLLQVETARDTATCDDDSAWPLVDGTVSILAATVSAGGILALAHREPAEGSPEAIAWASAVVGAATVSFGFGWSAKVGERRVDRCAKQRRGSTP
jgi:hypothetical protein